MSTVPARVHRLSHRPLILLCLYTLIATLLPLSSSVPVTRAQPVQQEAATTALLVVGGTAAGGHIRLMGYGFPAGALLSLRLVTPQGAAAATLGSAQTSSLGILPRTTLPLPASIAPGPYTVQALRVGLASTLVAQTAMEIWPAPEVTLSPPSAPPGSEVRVTVRNLLPGTLRLDYGGGAVIGPVAVAASQYQGSFVVPDSPAGPLPAPLPVIASNIVGDRLIGRGEGRFLPLAGSARPTFSFGDVNVSPAKLRPGDSFTITGWLLPAPAGPFGDLLLQPSWVRAGAPPFPLRGARTTIAPDGVFTISAQVPSLLRGDPIIARNGDRIDLSLVGLAGTGTGFEISPSIEDALTTLNFAVSVVKDKPGTPDDRKPVPNTPPGAIDVEIEPVGSMGLLPEEISGSISLDDGRPVLDMATINSILGGQLMVEQIKDLNLKVNQCTFKTPTIPQWQWGMGIEETIVASSLELGQFQLPGLGGRLLQPAGLAQSPGQLDPGEVLVQVFKVRVDASQVADTSVSPTQFGYGTINAENQAVTTTRYFVHIPDEGRTFAISTDNATATETAWPAPIALPPMPAGWTTGISLKSMDVSARPQPLNAAEVGPLYDFATADNKPLQDSITFEQATPISVSVRLNISPSQGATVNPAIVIKFGGTEYPATIGTDPEPRPSRCNDNGPPPPPEKFYFITVTPPNTGLPAGLHPMTIYLKEAGQLKQLHSFNLRSRDYRSVASIFTAPGTTQRRVQWRTWFPRLTATPEQAKSSVGGNMPFAGQRDSNVSAGASVTTVLTPYQKEAILQQSGSLGSQAMSNTGAPLGFGLGSPQVSGLSTSGGQSRGASLAADEPTYTSQVEILDTGVIPVAKFTYGVPAIATLTMSIDFRVRATMAYGTTDQLGVNTLLDSNVAVGITADVDILAGLASAEITFSPQVGVQIPAQLRWASTPVDVDKCFYYKLIVSWQIDALWGAVDITDGSATIFQGGVPRNDCFTPLPSALRGGALQAVDVTPESNPSLATDGLGRTLKLWRAADGQILSSELVDGAWAPAQPVTTTGRHSDPKVVFFAPGQAMAVWSRSGLSAAPAPGTPLATILRQQHLAYAIWENGTWSTPQNLTMPSTGDGKVALAACPATGEGCPVGGAVTAAWVRDIAGDIAQRQFRIYTASFQGGAWSTPAQVDPASSAAETEPFAIYRGEQPVILWVRDADRDINTLGDRRLALRALGAGGTEQPAQIPAGVMRPSAALDSTGALQLAFTVAREQDGPISNRQALHRAVGSCGAGASCSWGVAEQKDALGRSLFAESPVLTVDEANQVTVTYRAMGFGPLSAAGAPLSTVPETAGTLTGAGELAQLNLPATLGAGQPVMPTYLTSDGALNWRPAAVYDPALNSTVVLAVKGQAPQLAAAERSLVNVLAAEPAASADSSLVS